MQGKSAINTFNGGMSEDIDILHSDNTKYRFSMNGRLSFNKDGTYSWETENGSKVSFEIDARSGLDSNVYVPLGSAGNDNIKIVFSVREDLINSEIGIFSIGEDGVGQYKTLFNDFDDPNGDSLSFRLENQIEARFVYENDGLIRVYWVDGVSDTSNRPRVFTFRYDNTIGNRSDVNAYSASPNTSVHGMDSQSDFHMGLIKYVKGVGGNLITGTYQYTYRLRSKDGYNTPFYPLTRRVFVCNSAKSSINWNEYEMIDSGLVSAVGNRIQVKGIDQRYDEIHIAYVSTGTGNTVDEANIFAQTAITGETMEFDHVSNSGEPLLPEQISDLFSGIVGAKTLNIKDSTMYFGNVKENLLPDFDIEPILQNLSIVPKFRDMRSDEWAYTASYAVNSNPPVTHGWPRTGFTEMQQHNASGGIERYEIDNDYLNYKGTQVDHLYPGYFRGETYRFGIVFYDKLGFESFAFHLADFKFPNQSEDAYSWTRIKEDESLVNDSGTLSERAWPTNNYNESGLTSKTIFDGDTGQNLAPMDSLNPSLASNSGASVGRERKVSHLRIMGIDVSGINVSSISHLISGFKIVRVERDATILNQGIILPTVKVTDDDDGDIINPLPSTHQDFYDFGIGSQPVPGSNPSDIRLNDPKAFNKDGNAADDRFKVDTNTAVLYAPSVNFGSAQFPPTQSQDKIVLVGGCWDEYDSVIYRALEQDQWYSKSYYSKNPFHYDTGSNIDPFPRYMGETTMSGVSILGPQGKQEEFVTGFDVVNYLRVRESSIVANVREAVGTFNSVFINHNSFQPDGGSASGVYSPMYRSTGVPRSLDDSGNGPLLGTFMGSFIYNYIRPNPNPYGGYSLSSLEQSIFITTGHFQPIGNPTFDTQGMPAGLVFNGIEVFGGDCYLDYHAFARLLPYYQARGGANDDYSDGRIFPLEYEFNHSMRFGPTTTSNGLSLLYPSCGVQNGIDSPQWAGAIHYRGSGEGIYEEFNLNATMKNYELLIFYSPKPVNFIPNDKYPVRWRFTREKVYGDPVDMWRIFQVNDFKDLNGQYGEITSSLYIFNQIYSWQTSAFGRLRASDRALLESQQGGTLSTGIGDKLDGIDYISTDFGNQHQWSLFGSDNAAYWADVNKRKLIKFAQDGKQPLSDIKECHQFLEEEMPLFENNDNPIQNAGIHGTFDYGNNEAIFTFNRDRELEKPKSGNIITINSRLKDGKTFSKNTIRNNETAIVSDLDSGVEIHLPVGNTTFGINDNFVMYLCVKGLNPASVYSVTSSGQTSIGITSDGVFFRLYRHSLDQDWIMEQVSLDDATPYRASLSYNEYGDYFQGYHSYQPSIYMSTKYLVISHDNISGYSLRRMAYVHDLGEKSDFPGFSRKSVLTVPMSDGPMASKVMDSIRVNANNDFNQRFDRFLMQTESQYQHIDMTIDTRKKYLEDVLRFPLRAVDQKDRMRGKHILMTFEMKYNYVYNDRITNLVTYYRPSNRL